MKERIKRFLKTFLVLVILFIPVFITPIVRADSGWDSDYDSGGSWDSDYDSGSSYDYDFDYGGSSSSGGGSSVLDVNEIIVILFAVMILSILINKKQAMRRYPDPSSNISRYNDITQEHLSMVMPGNSLITLKKMAFDNFVNIQNAWMNFDYEKLRELCTDELYNSYVSQLETLKLKNGKNIMKDFIQNDIKIIDIDEVNGDITLTVFMSVSFYDYVINTTNQQVTRGNKSVKITNNYVLTFVVKADYNNTESVKCPHCGAPIEHVTSGRCEYCNSTIVKKASKFVLSKKTNVNR